MVCFCKENYHFFVNKVVLEHSQHLFIYTEQQSMAAIALQQQS